MMNTFLSFVEVWEDLALVVVDRESYDLWCLHTPNLVVIISLSLSNMFAPSSIVSIPKHIPSLLIDNSVAVESAARTCIVVVRVCVTTHLPLLLFFLFLLIVGILHDR